MFQQVYSLQRSFDLILDIVMANIVGCTVVSMLSSLECLLFISIFPLLLFFSLCYFTFEISTRTYVTAISINVISLSVVYFYFIS